MLSHFGKWNKNEIKFSLQNYKNVSLAENAYMQFSKILIFLVLSLRTYLWVFEWGRTPDEVLLQT